MADNIYYSNQNPRQFFNQRYSDIINPKPPEPQMTKEDVIKKLKEGGITITHGKPNESGGTPDIGQETV